MDNAVIKQQINDAVRAHGEWKHRLKVGAAKGAIEQSAANIHRDDQCAFGKWLVDIGRDGTVGSDANFLNVKRLHKDFHATAGKVADCIECGDLEKAKASLDGSEFDTRTKALVGALMQWRAALA